jgi:two-component system, cell cycle response regulator DivK
VLIVDDYQDCRDMYGTYLSLAGYRVLKAMDGLEALRLASTALPDVILMDLSLPGIDGYEVTRRLKSDLATRFIPIIALTAQTPVALDSMRRAGFEASLTKPCLPEALATEVSRVAPAVRRGTAPAAR